MAEERKVRMIEKKIRNFDIHKICNSGQCFRIDRIGEDTYGLVAFGEYLEIGQEGDRLSFSCTEAAFENRWSSYFDLDTDYGDIEGRVDKTDAYLTAAVRCGSGMRILRQDLWEVIVSFIISQQNNIPRIRKCVEALCRNFGEKKENFRGEEYYTFPTAEVLAGHKLEDFSVCSLGYRAKYIWKTAEMVADGEVALDEIEKMDYASARAELMKLCGVGIKVAECICLFALHHVDAFPIDTHIKSMLERHYPEGFPFERYRGIAGILQQYGFYYELWGTDT